MFKSNLRYVELVDMEIGRARVRENSCNEGISIHIS